MWNAKISPRNRKNPAAAPTAAPRTSRFTFSSISALASSISSRTSAEALSEMRFTMSPSGASTSLHAVSVAVRRQGASRSGRAGSRRRTRPRAAARGARPPGLSGATAPYPFTDSTGSSAAVMISASGAVIQAGPRRTARRHTTTATRLAAMVATAPMAAIRPLHIRRLTISLSRLTRGSKAEALGSAIRPIRCHRNPARANESRAQPGSWRRAGMNRMKARCRRPRRRAGRSHRLALAARGAGRARPAADHTIVATDFSAHVRVHRRRAPARTRPARPRSPIPACPTPTT